MDKNLKKAVKEQIKQETPLKSFVIGLVFLLYFYITQKYFSD